MKTKEEEKKESSDNKNTEPKREDKFPNKVPDIFAPPVPSPFPNIFGWD